jgi:hypothetical protein
MTIEFFTGPVQSAAGLPRFARNDGKVRVVIARSLRRGNPATAPVKALAADRPQLLDCRASLAMTVVVRNTPFPVIARNL